MLSMCRHVMRGTHPHPKESKMTLWVGSDWGVVPVYIWSSSNSLYVCSLANSRHCRNKWIVSSMNPPWSNQLDFYFHTLLPLQLTRQHHFLTHSITPPALVQNEIVKWKMCLVNVWFNWCAPMLLMWSRLKNRKQDGKISVDIIRVSIIINVAPLSR